MLKRVSIFLIASLLLACNKTHESSEKATKEDTVPLISASFSKTYPHDTNAFTEGLVMHNGQLYESTGAPKDMPETKSLFGSVDLNTGKINPKAELDRNQYFGEGIAFLNGKVFQLTYKSKEGFIYNDSTFQLEGKFTIPSKEGWGFTTDGTHLIMSDGSSSLFVLDPESLKVVKKIAVTENGDAKTKLNELEYIKGYIYANIWETNIIVKIDPASGKIVGKLDLNAYAKEAKSIYAGAMEMNGIAYNPETGKILITGKMWPKIYELSISL